jgi:cytochrome c5
MKMIVLLSAIAIATACAHAGALPRAQEQEKEQGKAAAEAPKADRGEAILKESCLVCHDMSNIALQFLDKEEWTAKIKAMLELGAELKPDDMPVLADYLAKKYGYQLPEGEGKAVFERSCKGMCHDVQRIVILEWSRARWDDLREEMIVNGAEIEDDEYDALLGYLARNFKPQSR